jgi:hypothetical protein
MTSSSDRSSPKARVWYSAQCAYFGLMTANTAHTSCPAPSKQNLLPREKYNFLMAIGTPSGLPSYSPRYPWGSCYTARGWHSPMKSRTSPNSSTSAQIPRKSTCMTRACQLFFHPLVYLLFSLINLCVYPFFVCM